MADDVHSPDRAASVASVTPPAPSALRLTLRTPFYRGATVAMLLAGLAQSAAAPQIASFLVRELDASLTVAGLFYLTNLTAPVVGYLIGARSDRIGRRLGLFRICAVIGAVGWLGVALAPQLWMPFVLSAVLLGFAGAAGSQIFAALHDELSARPTPAGDGVVAIVRMALTAGWIIGPVLGTFLAAQLGLRAMLVVSAICTFAQILPIGTLRTAPPARHEDATERMRGPSLRAMLPLLAFTGLYVCVYAGESVKYAYLPLYMSEQLEVPALVAGAVIGIQPAVELVLMPVAVIVGRRIGVLRLMVGGAALGIGANLLFALSGDVAGLFAGQVLMGGVWGVFAALGIIVAQRLLPTAVATASAIFMSSTALSSALGGLAGGIGAGAIGLPLVFLVPAAFAVIATIGLTVLAARRGRGI